MGERALIHMTTLRWALVVLSLLAGAALHPHVAAAQDKDAETKPTPDPELAAILKKEKEARRDCKIKICRAFRQKDLKPGNISCRVVKTLPKSDLNKMMSRAKVSWPYGRATCTADLNIPRQALIDAASKPDYVLKLDEHVANCTIKREAKSDYEISVGVAPTITFKNGTAIKAHLTWGKLTAPMLAKGVIWPATGLDNKLNIFGSKVVEITNSFTTKKCDEVKEFLE